MWVSTQGRRGEEDPLAGEVTSCGDAEANIQCAGEYRDVPLLAPGGIAWAPQNGQKCVVLPLAGGAVCAGVTAPKKGLEPGELMLFSAGGASIVLKNSGEVLINGKPYAG